jgi:hypothetical protein
VDRVKKAKAVGAGPHALPLHHFTIKKLPTENPARPLAATKEGWKVRKSKKFTESTTWGIEK